MHHLSNWTLKKLPLIQKGKEAEKAQSALNAEIDRLKSDLKASEGKVKGLEKDISLLNKEHAKALKAKDESLQQKVSSAVKAALGDASEKIIADYKVSDEFVGYGFEYLERGIKATARWAEAKEKEVGTLKASDLVGLGFGDAQFAKALQDLEDEVVAPEETATLGETEAGGAGHADDQAEVTNVNQINQSEDVYTSLPEL